MNFQVPKAPLTNLQHELLKLYNLEVSETELADIKHIIGTYFLQKASKEASLIWNSKGYDNNTLNSLLNK